MGKIEKNLKESELDFAKKEFSTNMNPNEIFSRMKLLNVTESIISGELGEGIKEKYKNNFNGLEDPLECKISFVEGKYLIFENSAMFFELDLEKFKRYPNI